MTSANKDNQIFAREAVPAGKDFRPSTRGNSAYKWQDAKGVIGALEVPSEPNFDPNAPWHHMTSTNPTADDELFELALQAFRDAKLRNSFIAVTSNVPVATSCCGLIQNDHQTMRDVVPQLNRAWLSEANDKLKAHGVKVDVFLWKWSNISGQSETILMLVRFFDTSKL